MPSTKHEILPLKAEADIVHARQQVRKWALEMGFSLVDQTKIVTAASELARNTIVYGKGGTMKMDQMLQGMRKGLQLVFEDKGPGIVDIKKALEDGYTTGGGMGLGLSGAKRLSNEFEIDSEVGKGTRISITRWK